jgi:hypothetical protein
MHPDPDEPWTIHIQLKVPTSSDEGSEPRHQIAPTEPVDDEEPDGDS